VVIKDLNFILEKILKFLFSHKEFLEFCSGIVV